MDLKLLDTVAALVRHLGYLRTGSGHLFMHHTEEKRLESEEVFVHSGHHHTMRGDQCFVSLYILARTGKPEKSRGSRGGKRSTTSWWLSTTGGLQSDQIDAHHISLLPDVLHATDADERDGRQDGDSDTSYSGVRACMGVRGDKPFYLRWHQQTVQGGVQTGSMQVRFEQDAHDRSQTDAFSFEQVLNVKISSVSVALD